MHPPILLDGPGSDLPSAGRAVIELHRRLLARFTSQRSLDDAYAEALASASNDPAFETRFESAFRELAAQVHLQHRLPANAEFFYGVRK